MAIKEMRETISEGKLDLRTKLIAIILFVCFETYHGNSASAVAQIRAGSSMIEEKCRKWNTDNGALKPPPDIDDELLESFTELEIQVATHSGYAMDHGQQERLTCRQDILASMPGEFRSLHHARVTLHMITIRQIHWGKGRKERVDCDLNRGCLSPTTIEDLESHFNEKSYLERSRRFIEWTRWAAAFEPLLREARACKDVRRLKCAMLLRAGYLASYLSLFAAMLSFKENYYKQTHVLVEIIALVKDIGTDKMTDNDLGFSMDTHVIIPLILVAWRYRHRALRQEAIKVLLAFPRREGLWDGGFIGKTAQWMAEVEEEGLGSEEYVPHNFATNVKVTDVDVLARTATLQALLKDKHSPEEMVMKETKIRW
jgi:hypothetical protein